MAGCGCGCEDSQIQWDDFPSPTSDWIILEVGTSTGVPPYIYSSAGVSRYRTEQYGKVARLQLYIESGSPGSLTVLTSIAQMPGDISTGKSYLGGGIAVAPLSTPNLMFPLKVTAGLIAVLCATTILEMSTDEFIFVDMTYPLD